MLSPQFYKKKYSQLVCSFKITKKRSVFECNNIANMFIYSNVLFFLFFLEYNAFTHNWCIVYCYISHFSFTITDCIYQKKYNKKGKKGSINLSVGLTTGFLQITDWTTPKIGNQTTSLFPPDSRNTYICRAIII